jgi:UDP-2-acetamido-3-amino-2,3-dideoxy-glucuronate N-acetyltransferase
VTADVPAHALVLGNPARRTGWACECGRRLPDDLRCGCGRWYRHSGYGVEFDALGAAVESRLPNR